MSDAHDGTTAAAPALRRCPGCHNRVTTQTARCPVCGQHAVAVRVASAVRWAVLLAGVAGLVWWGLHR